MWAKAPLRRLRGLVDEEKSVAEHRRPRTVQVGAGSGIRRQSTTDGVRHPTRRAEWLLSDAAKPESEIPAPAPRRPRKFRLPEVRRPVSPRMVAAGAGPADSLFLGDERADTGGDESTKRWRGRRKARGTGQMPAVRRHPRHSDCGELADAVPQRSRRSRRADSSDYTGDDIRWFDTGEILHEKEPAYAPQGRYRRRLWLAAGVALVLAAVVAALLLMLF